MGILGEKSVDLKILTPHHYKLVPPNVMRSCLGSESTYPTFSQPAPSLIWTPAPGFLSSEWLLSLPYFPDPLPARIARARRRPGEPDMRQIGARGCAGAPGRQSTQGQQGDKTRPTTGPATITPLATRSRRTGYPTFPMTMFYMLMFLYVLLYRALD